MKSTLKVPFFLLSLCIATRAAGGTLTGIVRNGTTGMPGAGVEVALIQLRGGMETVANTKSDAQGRYRLEHAGIGSEPMLLRVVYRGISFHQSLPPGRDTADVQVYEPTSDASTVRVTSRLIALQPNGAELLVGEEFTVQNQSSPPRAYYKADGSFEFGVPEGAELAQVSSWGPSGMPVVQGTISRGPRHYAIAFAFRPGESGVRLSYRVPYPSNQATLKLSSPYGAGRVVVIAQPPVQVLAENFSPSGTEQGYNVYARDAVLPNATLVLSVAGTAPQPPSSEQRDQSEQGSEPGTAGTVMTLPSRLDSLKWVLLVGFAALFILGAAFLWRRPAAAVARATATGVSPVPKKGKRTPQSEHRPEEVISEADRAVSQSLDALKESLFRLELRRQAGTISEEEYARERSRTEKVLRDLVKG